MDCLFLKKRTKKFGFYFMFIDLAIWPFNVAIGQLLAFGLFYDLCCARHLLSFQVKRQCRELNNRQTGIDNQVLPPAHFFKKTDTGAGAFGEISEINKCDIYGKTEQKQQRAGIGILAPFQAKEQQSCTKSNDRNGWRHYFQN